MYVYIYGCFHFFLYVILTSVIVHAHMLVAVEICEYYTKIHWAYQPYDLLLGGVPLQLREWFFALLIAVQWLPKGEPKMTQFSQRLDRSESQEKDKNQVASHKAPEDSSDQMEGSRDRVFPVASSWVTHDFAAPFPMFKHVVKQWRARNQTRT